VPLAPSLRRGLRDAREVRVERPTLPRSGSGAGRPAGDQLLARRLKKRLAPAGAAPGSDTAVWHLSQRKHVRRVVNFAFIAIGSIDPDAGGSSGRGSRRPPPDAASGAEAVLPRAEPLGCFLGELSPGDGCGVADDPRQPCLLGGM